jgi:hypothetical protein
MKRSHTLDGSSCSSSGEEAVQSRRQKSKTEEAMDVLEEMITCPTCLDKYSRSGSTENPSKNAKVLSCLHAFCKGCISEIATGCKGLAPLSCGMCLDESSPGVATRGCVDCGDGLPLCDSCHDSMHSKVLAFKTHKIVSIAEYRDWMRASQQHQKCPLHKTSNVDLACETCSQAICSLCVDSNHFQHKKQI